jgi:hypothetical protein
MNREISNTDSIIDSRDVIARIEELKDEWIDATESEVHPDELVMSEEDWQVGLGVDGAHELLALLALQDEADCTPDWQYGETLIHEDYFTTYVEELLVDIGYLPDDLPSFIHIDWERTADDLKVDYFEVEFDGETFYVRH